MTTFDALMEKPLNPDFTFRHVSVHVVHILARLMAKKAVQEQLRNEGVRPLYVLPREINERARAYLRDHPEVWREAIAMAHRVDDREGKRKERLRLRRKELAQLRKSRHVATSDHAKTGTHNAG
jgi:hypothetical protein